MTQRPSKHPTHRRTGNARHITTATPIPAASRKAKRKGRS